MPLTNDYPFKVGEKFRVIDPWSTDFTVGTEVTLLDSINTRQGGYQFKGKTKYGDLDWYWLKPEHLELLTPTEPTIQLYPLIT